jgi:S-adenosylmethionine:tRNA ribosyltransferase-isomerase
MRTNQFDYHLPPHLIAQEPCAERDRSRLLVVRRRDGSITHHVFSELPDLLSPEDLVILNDTRVLPARLLGRRASTGGQWQGLFLGQLPDGTWEMMSRTRGRLHPGETILIEPGPLQLLLVSKSPEGRWAVKPSEIGKPVDLLARFGHMPLPPYIRKGRAGTADRERYQTVYARRDGAVAAPTAGLHFTARVFERLQERGIGWSFVTLHVGPATFRPVEAENVEEHVMHSEWGELSVDTADAISRCKKRDGRVVAVGTTAVRVLETAYGRECERTDASPWSGDTQLFIYPPYQFRIVDALVTNFHLPRTSLLLLVSAFAGIELTRQAYQCAIEHEYRFYSYGDAMLIL